jgi:hypothetical protein
MANMALREHVTRDGFTLKLSKGQIQLLVLLDHFGGYGGYWNSGHRMRNFVTAACALTRRGLINHPGNQSHKPTRAGECAIGLLRESGVYEDVLTSLGVEVGAL